MQVISRTIRSLEMGSPVTHGGLTVFPMIGTNGVRRREKPDYITLDEGIASRTVKITELGSGGSVPELQLVNEGKRRVLILDGEMLIGAKQNRVLNITILAPGKCRLTVPVSCVEAGRWRDVSAAFGSPREVMYARGRARKMEQVNLCMDEIGRPMSDQTAIWSGIAHKAHRMGAKSPTGDMNEIYGRYQERIAEYEKAFPAVPLQVGAVFALGDRLAGMELFDHPETLAGYLPRLVRSNALDALELQTEPSLRPSGDAVSEFLGDLDRAEVRSYPDGIGDGDNFRLEGPRVSGAALVDGDRIVHLSAFRKEREAAPNGGGTRRNPISLRRWRR